MIEEPGGAGLLLEAAQARRVLGEVGGEDLDGDLAPQPRILRAVDLAHPTGAERRDDLVGAKPGADAQSHRGVVIRNPAVPTGSLQSLQDPVLKLAA